jgi:hypothetical protein
MADTSITCTVSPCTVIVQLDSPLLSMSPEDGLQIALSIVGVWTLGFCIRAVIKVLHDGGSSSSNESE